MIKKAINLISVVTFGLLLLNVVVPRVHTYADSFSAPSSTSYNQFAAVYNNCAAGTSNGKCDACNALNQFGDATCGQGQGKISTLAGDIVNIISYLAGVIAIILIIVAGIRFTTSGGDSGQVASARTALLYALIGVAVAALAQILVHFVLNQTSV